MDEVAAELDIPLVDPRSEMLRTPHPDEHFWVSSHLTEEGARVLATEVVRQVEEAEGLEAVAQLRPAG